MPERSHWRARQKHPRWYWGKLAVCHGLSHHVWQINPREWEQKCVPGQCYQESENGNLFLVSAIKRMRMETCPWLALSGEWEWKLGQCSFSTMVLTISGFLLFNKVILCNMLNYHHTWQNCQYWQRTRFSLCDHLQIYPLTLSASRFLIPDFALLVPVLFPAFIPSPSSSDRNSVWTPSNITSRHFLFQNNRPAMFSIPHCNLPLPQVPVCCLFWLLNLTIQLSCAV